MGHLLMVTHRERVSDSDDLRMIGSHSVNDFYGLAFECNRWPGL